MSTTATTQSKSGRTIKLTSERWYHITESHDYMAGYFYDVLETINDPDCVVAGTKGELLAIKFYRKTRISSKHLICCYREKNKEGFVITAFMTSKVDSILKGRKILWRRQ